MSEKKNDDSKHVKGHHEHKKHHEHKSDVKHEHKSDKKHHEHNKHGEKHHEHKSTKVKDSKKFYQNPTFLGGIVAVLFLALIASVVTDGFSSTGGFLSNLDFTSKETQKANVEVTGEPVELEFYVMSQCPYGTQVLDAIYPVLNTLGGNVDFKVDYIVSENADGSFDSLHGEPEVLGNIAQLCAMEYEPEKYMDMVVCMNENYQQIPGNWESCAQSAGLDVSSIKTCYEGNEGKELLSASALRAESVGATGSPTMYLNGQLYQGGRESNDFLRALCANLEGVSACENIPECSADSDCPLQEGMVPTCVNPGQENAACEYSEDVKMEAIVLSDERCGLECDQVTDELAMILQQNFFTGVTYRYVDYSDGGKELMERLGITTLPTFVFEDSVADSFAWKQGGAQFQSAFQKSDDFYYIISDAIGVSFDPSAEICDNGVDDTGNGLVDCEDETCSNKLVCNENLFVDCAANYDISEDSVLFYYSDTCPWCTMMKPGVEQLNNEGYSIVSINSADPVEREVIDQCFSDYMSGSVPQFVCLKKNEVKVGAFTTAQQELDVNGMRAWVDSCIN